MSELDSYAPAPEPDDWEVQRQHLRRALGARMKAVRRECGLTLDAAAQRSGLALSTIHKIENGRVSPSYENLVRVARAYEVGIERLFSDDHESPQTTRMTVTRAGMGRTVRTKNFEYEVLCNALTDKKIIPLVTRVERREPLGPADMEAHTGEETLFVLSGQVEVTVDCLKIGGRRRRIEQTFSRCTSVPWISSTRSCSFRSSSAPHTRAIFFFVEPPRPSTNAASSLPTWSWAGGRG